MPGPSPGAQPKAQAGEDGGQCDCRCLRQSQVRVWAMKIPSSNLSSATYKLSVLRQVSDIPGLRFFCKIWIRVVSSSEIVRIKWVKI